jgi:hypothetical protein
MAARHTEPLVVVIDTRESDAAYREFGVALFRFRVTVAR